MNFSYTQDGMLQPCIQQDAILAVVGRLRIGGGHGNAVKPKEAALLMGSLVNDKKFYVADAHVNSMFCDLQHVSHH